MFARGERDDGQEAAYADQNLDTTKYDPEVSIASWRAGLSEEGKRTLDTVRAAKLLPTTDAEHIDSFGTDSINELKPNFERSQLTQVKGNLDTILRIIKLLLN